MGDLQLWLIGVMGAVISYFLKGTMDELKQVKTMAEDNKTRIVLLENNHTHLTDKFDQLFDAVKDLTKEIKMLNYSLSKKKDI